jgi:hypothetical protein
MPVLPTPVWMMSIWSIKKWVEKIEGIPSVVLQKEYESSPIYEFFQKTTAELSWRKEEIENYLKGEKNLFTIFKKAKWWTWFTPFSYEDVLLPKFKQTFKDLNCDDLWCYLTEPKVIGEFLKNWFSFEDYIDSIVKYDISWKEGLINSLKEKIIEKLKSENIQQKDWKKFVVKQLDKNNKLLFIRTDWQPSSLQIYLLKKDEKIENYL